MQKGNTLSQSFTKLVSTLGNISLEHQILLAGARIHLGQDDPATIQPLLQQESNQIDWAFLLALARHNGLIPVLYQVVNLGDKSSIPSEVLETLKWQVLAMAHFTQGLIQELASLTQKFPSAGLDILAYKGPTLALAAYGDLCLRQSGDLDFLVASEAFEAASQFFQHQGYVIHAVHSWAICFRRDSSKVEIDLHQNVAGFYLPFQLDFQGIWARRKQTEIAGIRFHHPCEEDLVLLLCVQFAKDAHDNQRKLIKACDIAAVIRHSSLDWTLILEIAQQCKGDRPLKLGLSIIEHLFGVQLPASVCTYAHSDWVVNQYRHCICREVFSSISTHRSVLELGWRALFLVQHPLLEWQYNQRLTKLFLHSIVNKIRKEWLKRTC